MLSAQAVSSAGNAAWHRQRNSSNPPQPSLGDPLLEPLINNLEVINLIAW